MRHQRLRTRDRGFGRPTLVGKTLWENTEGMLPTGSEVLDTEPPESSDNGAAEADLHAETESLAEDAEAEQGLYGKRSVMQGMTKGSIRVTVVPHGKKEAPAFKGKW
jgi:hypothetical protein